MLAAVVKRQALGRALALVVARALADGVDVAPVGLGLRVLERVAVDLGGGGEEEAGAGALFFFFFFFESERFFGFLGEKRGGEKK